MPSSLRNVKHYGISSCLVAIKLRSKIQNGLRNELFRPALIRATETEIDKYCYLLFSCIKKSSARNKKIEFLPSSWDYV